MQGKAYIKKFLPRTLLGRSLVILIAPILLVQLLATYIFFDRHWDKITQRMAYAVAGEAVFIARSIEENPEPENILLLSETSAQSLGFFVEYKNGEILQNESSDFGGSVTRSGSVRALETQLKAILKNPLRVRADFNEKRIRVVIQLKKGLLDISVPQRRLYTSSGYVFLLWMLGASFLLTVVSVVFMRNQIRPIRKLAAAAERLGKGRDIPFFKPEGATEVRQAGYAFLDMHERIRRQVEQRTAMLAGVSHDLRTPLTRMKLQLAMMGDHPDVEALQNDVAQMETMISGYLDFVRGEGSEQSVLSRLDEIAESVANNAKRQGVDVVYHGERQMQAVLKPVAFQRCLMNLVSNAGKYAQKVWLEIRRQQDAIYIFVDDNGPGIPEDKYEDVFRPFYRVDVSRSAQSGSVGLGLPIVRDIVHAHGGEIWLEKSSHGGLRVTIKIPV